MRFEVERSKTLTAHYYLPSLFSLTSRGVPIMETRESVCLAKRLIMSHLPLQTPSLRPSMSMKRHRLVVSPISLFSHLETSMDIITGKQVGMSAFHQDNNTHAKINL